MFGDNHIRSIAFVRQHQRLAQPLSRLRQDCRIRRDYEEAPSAGRYRPAEKIGGDGGRLADADWSFAGDEGRIWATMAAGGVERAALRIALAATIPEASHIGIEGRQPLEPARFRCVRRFPMRIEGCGVGMIGIHKARKRQTKRQAVHGCAVCQLITAKGGFVLSEHGHQKAVGARNLFLVPGRILVVTPATA